MVSAISPDIGQSMMVTLYLMFSHNYEAIAYFSGMLLGIALSVWKPSRFSIFVLLGFAVLLFSFEYDKHIITGLRNQTLLSLSTAQPHLRFQRLINLFISEFLPIFFYVLGWGMIFTSIFYAGLKLNKVKDYKDKDK